MSYTETKEVQVTGNTPASFNFTLNYTADQFSGIQSFPVVLTYTIRENKPENTLESTHDSSVYTATITVTKASNGKIEANLTSLKKGSATAKSADFVNTLLGDLSFEKKVVGGQLAMDEEFTFELVVQPAKNSGYYANLPVTVTINGTSTQTTTSGIGILKFEGVKHGDVIEIDGIPLGAYWKLIEMCEDPDAYKTTWEIVGGASGEGVYTDATLTGDSPHVIFTNTSTYVLPETGGAGTIPYTMAGLVLILFSMAYLMYRPKARGKGES
jgi:pilin isopeptide linkage protein/LPXTG-motif cell wall-anchored protein